MNNILKNVCSAQKLHGAEHAGSMEHREMEERNSRYRCLKMKAAAAWALAVLLSLLSVFGGEVPYVNEIQMSLAALVLLFPGNAFYAAARKQLCAGRIGLDTLIAFGASVAFLFSLFNTFFPDYWLRVGLHPYVYYEVAVLVVAVGLTGKVFRFLPEERHGADRIARIFFPVLAGTAVAVFFIWIFWGGMTAVPHAFYAVVSVFIVACPCALGLVAPLALTRGIGRAADMHIRIKDSLALERLDKADVVVFDKTGTLTRGVFNVTAIHPDHCGEAQLLELAALAESYSDHPISRSLKEAYGKELDASRVSNVEELSGRGVRATVDGRQICAGNDKLMEDIGVSWHPCHRVGTTVHVASDGVYLGHIVISDEVKPDAKEAITALKACGVRRTVMLTGDAEPVAKAVSAQLGLDEYHAGLLPGDKVDQIETLIAAKKSKENLAFVGDGINDAPVLSRADVGIAMGALGSDAAIEAADVVLMDDDPAKIALAMRIARRTLRIVYENIVFALAVKFACLLLGAIGMASMWTAIFADVGVMVIAVLNATRALYTKDLVRKSQP